MLSRRGVIMGALAAGVAPDALAQSTPAGKSNASATAGDKQRIKTAANRIITSSPTLRHRPTNRHRRRSRCRTNSRRTSCCCSRSRCSNLKSASPYRQ